MLPIFWGRHGKHFRQPRQNFSLRCPEKMPKTQFLQMTTFRGRFLCTRWMQFWQVCQKFFIRRLNFLKYFYFSEKKTVFSHIFSRGMTNADSTTWHTFNCTEPLFSTQGQEKFYCLLFFSKKKLQNGSWNTWNIVLETRADFFGQKPQFLNSKSENNFKKFDSLPES